MSAIRTRKHAPIAQPKLSLLAVAVLSMPIMPMAAHAQQARPEQTMPEIKVESSAEGLYKVERAANPKLTEALINTPQTISVIRKELLQEQGAVSLMEALRNTPGITMQLGENGNTAAGDTFQMRGFATQTSVFVDGVRDLGAVSRDAFNVDQIEVVKGPAGADIGRGAASGYINLVTKAASLDSFSDATLSINSVSNKRATVDLNRQIGATSAFRINGMVQDGGVAGRDVVEANSRAIAPSFAFGLGSPTRLFLYSQHLRQDNTPDGAVPTIGLAGFYNANPTLQAGTRVDPENFYGSSADHEKIDADMATVKIEHDFSKGIVLRNITRYGKSKIDRVLSGVGTTLAAPSADMATWTTNLSRQAVQQQNEIFANQTNVTAALVSGDITHSLTGGLEFMLEKQNTKGFAAPAAASIPLANLYHPNPNVVLPAPGRNGAYANGSTSTAALYAADTLHIGKSWMLNGGLRFERYHTDTNAVSLSTAAANPTLPVGSLLPTNPSKSDSLLSWKVGALYKPASNGSVYVAYANALTPPGSANFTLSAVPGNVNHSALDASKSTNLEFGTKWDLLQKKLSLTAALYRTDVTNELTLLDAVTNSYAQTGKRRVQGVELGLAGQLSTAWQVSAGLATMDTTILQGTTGNNSSGAMARWSPDLTATLWTSYEVSPAWSIGGGVRYLSAQQRVIDPNVTVATQNMPEIPQYSVLDAVIGYQASKTLSLQFNIYNILDKFYVNTLNNGGARYLPGAPRSAMLTASLRY